MHGKALPKRYHTGTHDTEVDEFTRRHKHAQTQIMFPCFDRLSCYEKAAVFECWDASECLRSWPIGQQVRVSLYGMVLTMVASARV
jgi:hypothetical protein